MLLLSTAGGVANARGVTAQHLQDSGWTCIVAGPPGWTHCTPPGNDLFSGSSPATAQVLVFESLQGEYFGTEILVREDLYERGMQPCMTDGGGAYESLAAVGLPYYACHHFDTSHWDYPLEVLGVLATLRTSDLRDWR